MRRIPLNSYGQFKTREVIVSILEMPSGNQGINYAEMRKRTRILDALEISKSPYFDIEDADYEHLVKLMNDFQFAVAKRELARVLDDIEHAKPPPHLKEVAP